MGAFSLFHLLIIIGIPLFLALICIGVPLCIYHLSRSNKQDREMTGFWHGNHAECPSCETPVSNSALVCPKCGRALKV
jgi:hypothetical protein